MLYNSVRGSHLPYIISTALFIPAPVGSSDVVVIYVGSSDVAVICAVSSDVAVISAVSQWFSGEVRSGYTQGKIYSLFQFC